jgi:hypothetical protein
MRALEAVSIEILDLLSILLGRGGLAPLQDLSGAVSNRIAKHQVLAAGISSSTMPRFFLRVIVQALPQVPAGHGFIGVPVILGGDSDYPGRIRHLF